MKKLFVCGILLLIFNRPASAQTFKEGQNLVTAGYGFPNLYWAIFEDYEDEQDYTNSSFGPVYFKYEHMISNKFGLGLNFAYATNKIEYTNGFDYYNSTAYIYTHKIERVTYSVLGHVNYHFTKSEKFDAYAGSGIGYRYAKWTYTSNDPYNTDGDDIPNFFPFGFEITIGGRYLFNKHFGAYTELGMAKSPFQIGLTGIF
jgi:opacity protein-like surface antigen